MYINLHMQDDTWMCCCDWFDSNLRRGVRVVFITMVPAYPAGPRVTKDDGCGGWYR